MDSDTQTRLAEEKKMCAVLQVSMKIPSREMPGELVIRDHIYFISVYYKNHFPLNLLTRFLSNLHERVAWLFIGRLHISLF